VTFPAPPVDSNDEARSDRVIAAHPSKGGRLSLPVVRRSRSTRGLQVGVLSPLPREAHPRWIRREGPGSGRQAIEDVDDRTRRVRKDPYAQAADTDFARLRQQRHRLITSMRPDEFADSSVDPLELGHQCLNLLQLLRPSVKSAVGLARLEEAIELLKRLAWGRLVARWA
jgi:hypothetical protein